MSSVPHQQQLFQPGARLFCCREVKEIHTIRTPQQKTISQFKSDIYTVPGMLPCPPLLPDNQVSFIEQAPYIIRVDTCLRSSQIGPFRYFVPNLEVGGYYEITTDMYKQSKGQKVYTDEGTYVKFECHHDREFLFVMRKLVVDPSLKPLPSKRPSGNDGQYDDGEYKLVQVGPRVL
ncbi:hypothetical protein EG329_000729 [Mollisiaceae sp. DMI_Dod_QoI]|nr:hypothetical protein EG329_000729 [Helotiales sp. DMI_Dod_QoI]